MTTELGMPGFEQHLTMMGFNHNPFPVVPDARHYVMTDSLRDISHEILFAISQSKGFVVVTGDVGVGKTTLSRYLINRLSEEKYTFALILNTYLQEEDLIDAILKDFGLSEIIDEGVQSKLDRLNHFFLQKRKIGVNSVVIIDDAQNLSIKSLEVIRLLSNFETESEKLVQVLLIGQCELHEQLNLRALRQLKSRVVLSRIIKPFNQSDLEQYVLGRLSVNKSQQKFEITQSALKLVYRYSHGNLRRANLLLDRSLLGLVSSRNSCINSSLIKSSIEDISGKKTNRSINNWFISGLMTLIVLILVYFLVLSSMYQDFPDQQNTEQLDVIDLDAKLEASIAAETKLPKLTVITIDGWETYLQRFQLESISAESWLLMAQENYSQLIVILENVSQYRVTLLDASILSGLNELSGYQMPMTREGVNQYLFIWKPVLKVNDFRIGLVSTTIVQVQELLASLGFYTVPVDGQVGIKTIQALMRFQAFLGIPISGVIDNATLLAINHPGMFISS